MDDLLTIEETARWLRHSVRTLYDWRHRGFGPVPVDINGKILYRRCDIESFIARRATEGAAKFLELMNA